MEKIGILTDSTACLDEQTCERLGIVVVPLSITFGGDNTTISDGELSDKEFMERFRKQGAMTAAPSPGRFAQGFRILAERKVEQIVAILLSSSISGTYDSAVAGAEVIKTEYPNLDIVCLDSRSLSLGCGWQVERAAEMARAGLPLGKIISSVEELSSRVEIAAILDDLKYAEKGGRISHLQRLLGSLLRVKGLLRFREGVLTEIKDYGLIRSMVNPEKGAIYRLVEYIGKHEPLNRLAVSFEEGDPNGELLLRLLQERLGFDPEKIQRAPISTTLMTHAGPGLIGTVFERQR